MQDELSPTFGAILRQLRLERGLSLRDLAASSGLDRGHLSKLENDLLAPSANMLAILSTGLKVPMTHLYAAAGITAFQPLPTIQPYLRMAYNVSDEVAQTVEDYLRSQGTQDFSGPTDGEDELLE